MKVLHINTERTWRGGEQQLVYLARGLRDRRIEQGVVCQPRSPLSARARAEGIDVWELNMRGEVDFPAASRIASRLARGRYDLLHLHTSHAHTLGVAAAKLCHSRLRPKTVVSRRVDFSIYRSSFLGLNRLKYTFGTDRILCVSEEIRRVLREDGVPTALLGVVHSGIDPARFEGLPDRSEDYRREFRIPPRAPVIGNVAALSDHKGQRFLVAAAPQVLQRHPEARFLIVGEGELREALRRQVTSLHLEGRVFLPGFRTDVPSLLRFMDVYCMPSHQEGLGTSVLDAMASGTPVVAARAGGIPEMIDDGVHGTLVPPKDPEALAQALNLALDDPEKARSMAMAAKERVQRDFTVDSMVEGTIREYSWLLAGRRGPE
jgi:glycosyltransferase involved in cell wall biosynthesis